MPLKLKPTLNKVLGKNKDSLNNVDGLSDALKNLGVTDFSTADYSHILFEEIIDIMTGNGEYNTPDNKDAVNYRKLISKYEHRKYIYLDTDFTNRKVFNDVHNFLHNKCTTLSRNTFRDPEGDTMSITIYKTVKSNVAIHIGRFGMTRVGRPEYIFIEL